ncbi:MAG: ParB N-terminal domain-containing protein [Candidatus Undinarchaeales archaeon]|nr:ParB N-terminal domain-containing protein [Candidatus Undinarchaeales archaeon]
MEILKRFDNGSILALVSIDKIRGHEDVKEDYLAELTARIEEDGELYKPILVVNNDFVVLDGHHRFNACKNIGCKRITAFLIDYFREDVQVEAWYPLILDKEEADHVFETVKQAGFEVSEVESEAKMQELVDSRQASIGMIVHDSPFKYFITNRTDALTFSEAMKAIVSDLRARQKLPVLKYYNNPDEVKEKLNLGEAHMLIKVPKISKESVITRSNMEEKYPPKTTRHLVPDNVEEYHIPLDRLKEPNPVEDFEASEEILAAYEKHMEEHSSTPYESSIEWKFE